MYLITLNVCVQACLEWFKTMSQQYLSCEVGFFACGYAYLETFDSVYSNGCGLAHLDMSKVIPNIKFAMC